MKVVFRIITIILFFSSISILFAGGQKEVAVGLRTGTLVYLEGEVFINGVEAEIGDPVENTDVVKTGSDSYCEIVFGERNVFRLEENTLADIDWGGSSIKINTGTIGAVFTKLDDFISAEKEFVISTPSAVAGVRGTVFFIKIEDPNNTYLCICNGELDLDRTSRDLTAASEHHKAYRFTGTGDTVSYTSAPLIYHDDPHMESIASRIEYNIPWGETPGY